MREKERSTDPSGGVPESARPDNVRLRDGGQEALEHTVTT
jgi:hypothetical protein